MPTQVKVTWTHLCGPLSPLTPHCSTQWSPAAALSHLSSPTTPESLRAEVASCLYSLEVPLSSSHQLPSTCTACACTCKVPQTRMNLSHMQQESPVPGILHYLHATVRALSSSPKKTKACASRLPDKHSRTCMEVASCSAAALAALSW